MSWHHFFRHPGFGEFDIAVESFAGKLFTTFTGRKKGLKQLI